MMRRGVTPATVIGALAIVVSLSGAAVATGAGSLTLGTTNRATSTTTLHARHGVALSLAGRKHSPPLSVSGDKAVVPSLNVSRLDGLSATQVVGHIHVYDAPGETNVSVPARAHLALLTAVGGGGGGGGGGAGPGGAGGQGGYSQAYVPVHPGQRLQVIVGSGGTGAAANGAMANADSGSGGSNSGVGYGHEKGHYYVYAFGGRTGDHGSTCPTSGFGGPGGTADGPLPNAIADGAVDVALVDGAAGTDGTWKLSATHTCTKASSPGVGAGAGFSGAGGNGGASTLSGRSTSGADGAGGLVTVEYLR